MAWTPSTSPTGITAPRREPAWPRNCAGSDAAGTKSSDYILTVAFPHDELRILGYNRVVADLNGLSAADFLGRLADSLAVEPAPEPVTPERPAYVRPVPGRSVVPPRCAG